VRGKRRKSSSLMTIAVFLLGGAAATLAQSLASVVDLAA